MKLHETRDPGLQPERTILAWKRSLLSLLVADILIWRMLLHANTPPGSHQTPIGLGVAAFAAFIAPIAIVVCVSVRIRELATGETAVSSILLRVPTISVVLLAAATLYATL